MGYSIPSLVPFGQLLDPMKKNLFLKLFIGNKSKFPYEKLTLFLGKLYQKFFISYTLPTQGKLHAEFGSLSTTL